MCICMTMNACVHYAYIYIYVYVLCECIVHVCPCFYVHVFTLNVLTIYRRLGVPSNCGNAYYLLKEKHITIVFLQLKKLSFVKVV